VWSPPLPEHNDEAIRSILLRETDVYAATDSGVYRALLEEEEWDEEFGDYYVGRDGMTGYTFLLGALIPLFFWSLISACEI